MKAIGVADGTFAPAAGVTSAGALAASEQPAGAYARAKPRSKQEPKRSIATDLARW